LGGYSVATVGINYLPMGTESRLVPLQSMLDSNGDGV